jgi:hypothetical protein
MEASLKTKLERGLGIRGLPLVLVHDDKHGRPLWICNTFEDVLSALLEMTKHNAESGYYDPSDPELIKALAGDPESLVRFANGRKGDEYELWDLQSPEHLPPFPAAKNGETP